MRHATECKRPGPTAPAHTISVEPFRPMPAQGMLPLGLTAGALLVMERDRPRGELVKVVAQTDDYDEAYRIAHATAKVYGARVSVGSVWFPTVVGHEVAELSICEAHATYGDGTYECPRQGARANSVGVNALTGFHPCNRAAVAS